MIDPAPTHRSRVVRPVEFVATCVATLACLAVAVLPSFAIASAAENDVRAEVRPDDEPIEIDKEENVDVRLVLVEALVVDRAGRTHPELTREDFKLKIDMVEREIDVFDYTCRDGPTDDPVPVADETRRPHPPASLSGRRIVLLFDRFHNGQIEWAELMQRARRIPDLDMAEDDEVMVAAITGGLQIVQGFTRDPEEVHAALDLLQNDIRFWGFSKVGVTIKPFFRGLSRLMDVLKQYDGSKAVVMFSRWGAASAQHDAFFLDVAQRAADARVSFFPIHTAGLQSVGPDVRALARLANESGGRLSSRTNDVTVAYARAQRDVTCRYTLGFYLRGDEKPDSAREVYIKIRKHPGLSVRHAERVRGFDEDERREARALAAFHDVTRFADDSMRIALHPAEPRPGGGKWDALLVVDLPTPPLEEDAGEPPTLSITVSRFQDVVRSIDRDIESDPSSEIEDDDGRMRFTEKVRLAPGKFQVTAVLVRPDEDAPRSATAFVHVPEVPEDRVFLTSPLVGTIPDGDAAPSRPGRLQDLAGFEPLLARDARTGERIGTFARACIRGRGEPPANLSVLRRIVDASGATAIDLDPVTLDLPSGKGVRCQLLADRWPHPLEDAGDYRVEVEIAPATEDAPVVRAVPLKVVSPEDS